VLGVPRIGRFAAFVLCATLVGCGGSSSPTQPSTPTTTPTPPAVPVVRDGMTDQVVAAQVDPPAPRIGTRISVTAAGYLTREQLFEVPDIFLWPGESGYIHDLAYWEFSDGSFRTLRWNEPFTITLDEDLANDPAIIAKAQEVAAEASRHIGLPVSVGPGGAVTVGIDASLEDDHAVGKATVSSRGGAITTVRIVFWRRFEIAGGPRANYPNTFLHEMGHAIGLGHSPRNTDVMTPADGPGSRQATYQPGEASCLHMSYAHRRPGNFFPDRDPALAAASSAIPRTTVIIN
jgi:hypothetical protein